MRTIDPAFVKLSSWVDCSPDSRQDCAQRQHQRQECQRRTRRVPIFPLQADHAEISRYLSPIPCECVHRIDKAPEDDLGANEQGKRPQRKPAGDGNVPHCDGMAQRAANRDDDRHTKERPPVVSPLHRHVVDRRHLHFIEHFKEVSAFRNEVDGDGDNASDS